MPRPCQRRRESAAAQRKSNPNNPKPSQRPAPGRPKARQKAIHNAVRQSRANSRGNGRGGGRGGSRGGHASRNQQSATRDEANQDFISFASNGNNFNVLHAAGSRHDPITLDDHDGSNPDSMEDGELADSGSDEDDSEDMDMHDDTGALTINVQVDQGHRKRPGGAVVMFPMMQAIAIYKEFSQSGFPLRMSTVARYGVKGYDNAPEATASSQQTAVGLSQYSRVAFKSDTIVGPEHTPADAQSSGSSYISPAMSRQPSASTATSGGSAAQPGTGNPARDYVFDWGAHAGTPFMAVPENYLRTIAGNPTLLDKHPGVKEAFDFHRPNMRRTAPTARQLERRDRAPVQAPARGRLQGTRGKPNTSWTTFTFPSGCHANKKLNEVPENYLRTIEGMPQVVNKWIGLREALLDHSAKTGRKSKVAS
jgi:hypothetical protein